MAEEIRVFAALVPDVFVQEKLSAAAQDLRRVAKGLRPVRKENIHLTLRFFGEIPVDRLADVREACQAAAGRGVPFAMELAGVGFFPVAVRARVIWAGVSAGGEDAAALAAALHEESQRRGLPGDSRFSAHVTIARLTAPLPRDRTKNIEALLAGRVWGRTEVTEMYLLQTVQGHGGVVYERIGIFPLCGGHR